MLKRDLRPVLVSSNCDEFSGLFHCWSNETDRGSTKVVGVVETEDGNIKVVPYKDIQFIDSSKVIVVDSLNNIKYSDLVTNEIGDVLSRITLAHKDNEPKAFLYYYSSADYADALVYGLTERIPSLKVEKLINDKQIQHRLLRGLEELPSDMLILVDREVDVIYPVLSRCHLVISSKLPNPQLSLNSIDSPPILYKYTSEEDKKAFISLVQNSNINPVHNVVLSGEDSNQTKLIEDIISPTKISNYLILAYVGYTISKDLEKLCRVVENN